ncbi:polyamine-modulated factor 1-binding protein 1 isoform X1 [Clarias magur]|uniref:Polyamine-modulated factor 1-binding protein 1 isoform X1 n=1 Tax=Clarias magur TaxID=1594786 RepID=A0A8J4X4F7_CLAMG|nr:polyamine-modulated factor 1-binding protein 1 isoform X1 [Clarias magur]
MRRLQELMRKLQADAVCEAQSRQADVDALELRVTELEDQLEAARRQCVQKEQKRDALLRQSEADLVQAREKIRGKASEAERHVTTAQALQADLRQAKKEKREREAECGKLRAQLLQTREELKETRTGCRDSAQELARLEEKVLLLEGGHQRAQEQLAERVAEVVRSEQTQRRLTAELRRVQERLESSEQELHDCRTQMEQVKLEAGSSRQAQISGQQEALRLQQENQELQEELSSTKASVKHMQEQIQRSARHRSSSVVLSDSRVRGPSVGVKRAAGARSALGSAAARHPAVQQADEKLGLRIRDQSKKVIHLTAEKDHLQENVEKLQAEIRRLRTELDEQRMETERYKAFQSQSASEQLRSRQPSAL